MKAEVILVKQRLNLFLLFSVMMSLVLITSACSLNEDKDILFIRHHLDDYNARTEPFEEEMAFTLSTEEIIEGVEEPRLLKNVHDTEIYLLRTKKREDQYVIQFGLNSEIQSKGTVLSLFHLNPDQSYSRDLKYEVVNEKGETADIAYGGGDGDPPYPQSYHFKIEGAELQSGERWTFTIRGLYLLSYSKH